MSNRHVKTAVRNLFGRDRFVGGDVSTAGVGGETVQAVTRAMGSGGAQPVKLCSLTAAHLLLCGRVPNRLQPATGPRPGGRLGTPV